MHETFDHTADLGLRVRAATLDGLFTEAAEALFGTIVDDLSSVRLLEEIDVELHEKDLEYLFCDWLKALLFHFDAHHLLLGRFEAKVSDGHLKGKAWGEPLDTTRHILNHEVKAVTYHQLRVERCEGGWLAEVIVDI